MTTGYEDDEKLQRIFMPTADRKIEALLRNSDRLAHYTTAEAALNIIESESLWLRNALGMNDYSEVQFGRNILSAYFRNEIKRNRFKQAFDSIDTSLVDGAAELFDQWWIHIQTNSYLSCFSQHKATEDQYGRLSMWRGFGRNVACVAIVIKTFEKYSALPLKCLFRPVMYLEKPNTLELELDQVIKNVEAEEKFLQGLPPDKVKLFLYQMLHLAAVTLKHPGFHEEEEWRLCYFPRHSKSDYVYEETKVIHGVPQVIHRVELKNKPGLQIRNISLPEILDRVIVGPTQYAVPIAQSLSKAMSKIGIANPDSKIFVSDIPIRT